MSDADARDPWQPYSAEAVKGKGHPVVPESSDYGLVLVGLCVLSMLLARWTNRKGVA